MYSDTYQLLMKKSALKLFISVFNSAAEMALGFATNPVATAFTREAKQIDSGFYEQHSK